MSDFDLSLVIRSDGSQAVASANETAGAIDSVGAAQKRTVSASNDLASATSTAAQTQSAAAKSQRDYTAELVQASVAGKNISGILREKAAAEQSGATASSAAAGAASSAGAAYGAAATGATNLANATKNATKAANDNIQTSRAQQFAIKNVGQQVGDFGLQVAGGADPARAFSQQIGQLGYALSTLESGPLKGVGTFLAGPWGIALTIAAAVVAPFIEKLLSSNSALDEQYEKLSKATAAADAFGDAQSLLGKIVDLTTGKFKTQNLVLIESVKLQAQLNILKANAAATDALGGDVEALKPGIGKLGEGVKPTLGETASDISKLLNNQTGLFDFIDAATKRGGAFKPLTNDLTLYTAAVKNYQSVLNDPKSNQADIVKAGKLFDVSLSSALSNVGSNAAAAGRDVNDVKSKIIQTANSLTQIRANLDVISGANGEGVDPDLIPFKKDRKPKKPKKVRPDTTTPREAEEIQRINEAFDKTPTLIDKAAQATRTLDKIIADLSKRQPPGFEKLIADAQRAKGVVADSLTRPLEEYIKQQGQSLQIGALTAQGRLAEAEALKVIFSLQEKMAPLTAAQKNEVLATTIALRDQQRQIDIAKERAAKYTEALGSIKGVVQDATQAFVRGDLGQFIKAPGKLLDAFQTLQGRKLFDKLFDGAFRELQDQIDGTDKVKTSSAVMAEAVNKVSASSNNLSVTFDKLSASIGASGIGARVGSPSNDNGPLTTDAGLAALLRRGNGAPGAVDLGVGPDINVQGTRREVATSTLFANALGKVSTSILSIFTNKESAANIGASIGKFAGKGLEGAATGAAVNSVLAPLGKLIGVRTSSTGASIGGAIGSFVPIPGGQIIGSVLGSIIGGAFGKIAKPGGATIGSTNGQFGITGTTGSDASGIAAGNSLGGNVVSGLNSIVQQLGGTVGAFNVSIGKYKDSLRVNVNGRPLGGVTGSGATDFGTDEAAAVSFAISQAISQGAVQGLSAAVQKAIGSSSDVDKALAEALKTKQLEIAIGGIGAQLKQTFDTAAATAADNLRIAKAYGLDILKVEQYNADQRKALISSTLKAATGSLQDFLTSVASGDLFDGSAADQRAAIQKQIDAILPDAKAGKDGAADTLAQLEQQLLTVSKGAFGTAGLEYATDKNNAVSAVQQVIKMETDRINAAAGITTATTDAIAAGNALTNETNDLLAVTNSRLSDIAAGLASARVSGTSSQDLGYLARYSSLAA